MRFGWSDDEVDEAVANVRIALESGFIMDGEFTKKWKLYLSGVHNHESVQFVNSCSAALEMLCKVLGKGKALIVANNWTSIPGALIRAGWEPILIDISMLTLLPDPEYLEKEIIKHRPWIVEVPHLGGRVDPSIVDIRNICQKYSVNLIEDHSHTLGVKEPEEWPCADFTIRSFGSLKYASAGCGGAVTGKADVIERVANMSRYGRQKEFGPSDTVEECYSSRFNELSAALSWGLYRKFDFNAVMTQVAFYEDNLDHDKYKTYVGEHYNGYKYIVAGLTLERSIVQQTVEQHNLELSTGVWEFSLGDMYPDLECADDLPVTRSFQKYNFCLPTYPELSQDVMAEFVEILNGI